MTHFEHRARVEDGRGGCALKSPLRFPSPLIKPDVLAGIANTRGFTMDPVRFPRPVTRYFQEIHPPSFKPSTNDSRAWGSVLDTRAPAFTLPL